MHLQGQEVDGRKRLKAAWRAVVVCATAPSAGDVAAPLRAPGLLDHVLSLRAPAAEDRAELLASALQQKAALFDPDALQASAMLLPLLRLKLAPVARSLLQELTMAANCCALAVNAG